MLALKRDKTVYIAEDFVSAITLADGERKGKAYRVWTVTPGYTAIVAAPDGDRACEMMRKALKSENISVRATGLAFQIV